MNVNRRFLLVGDDIVVCWGLGYGIIGLWSFYGYWGYRVVGVIR